MAKPRAKTQEDARATALRLVRDFDCQCVDCRKAAKEAPRETALALGLFVGYFVAKGIGSLDGPCFDQDGKLTEKTKAAMFDMAHEGFSVGMKVALVRDWFDRQVVNQTRKEIGLDPIA